MTDPKADPINVVPPHDPVVTDTPAPGEALIAPKDPKRVRLRRFVLRAALALVIVTPLFFAVAALGSRFGLWGWRTGFSLTTNTGPILMGLSLVFGIIGLLLWVLVNPHRKPFWGIIASGLAILVPVVAYLQLTSVRATAASLPFIHDITTDTQDPPTFGAVVMAERDATDGVNTVEYAGKRVRGDDTPLVSAEQTQAYPQIRTLVLSEPPATVFARAEQAARDLGWAIKEADMESGRIDATDTTFWFGFKDDVAIRLRPASGGGTRLDVRSVSRVGGSDLGANAARIEDYLDAMRE